MTAAVLTPPAGARRLAGLQTLAMALLVAGVSIPLSASEVVGGGWPAKLALVGRMALLVAVAWWMLRAAGRRWADVGLRKPRRWWGVALAVVLGYLALPEYLYWALPVAWGSAAVGEELVARGFLTDRIATLLGGDVPPRAAVFAAVVLQGLLFGACHAWQGLGGALLTAGVGVSLGLVWLWTGRNLWAAIILHGLVDFVSMTAFYTGAVGGAA
jgi:membrane protease YdiL (CAAX protease family)